MKATQFLVLSGYHIHVHTLYLLVLSFRYIHMVIPALLDESAKV